MRLFSELIITTDSLLQKPQVFQKMPRSTLDFVEEPIRDECPNAYQSLRKLTDIPFAIGEEFASKWQFSLILKTIFSNLPELTYAMLEV